MSIPVTDMYSCIILGKRNRFHMWLINEKAFFYSKWQKQVDKTQYWKKMANQYAEISDEGALTNSQDETDHRVRPTDLMLCPIKRNKVGVIQWFGVLSMLMHNALEIL